MQTTFQCKIVSYYFLKMSIFSVCKLVRGFLFDLFATILYHIYKNCSKVLICTKMGRTLCCDLKCESLTVKIPFFLNSFMNFPDSKVFEAAFVF